MRSPDGRKQLLHLAILADIRRMRELASIKMRISGLIGKVAVAMCGGAGTVARGAQCACRPGPP
jgi:hypothetical protein